MTVPASNNLVGMVFDQVWGSLHDLRAYCLRVQSGTAGGVAIGSNEVLAVAQAAVTFRTIVNTWQPQTTLWNAVVAYAAQVTATASLTAQDFTAVFTSSGTLLNALAGEYPHDAQARLLDRTFSLTLGLQIITVTAAQMPNTMTAITNFLATLS